MLVKLTQQSKFHMKFVGVFKIHPQTKFYETCLLNRSMEYKFHAAHKTKNIKKNKGEKEKEQL
jgi:hypothetical protein